MGDLAVASAHIEEALHVDDARATTRVTLCARNRRRYCLRNLHHPALVLLRHAAPQRLTAPHGARSRAKLLNLTELHKFKLAPVCLGVSAASSANLLPFDKFFGCVTVCPIVVHN